jgi:hypothetical protein
VAVDGEQIPREQIRFTIEDRTYTLDEMEQIVDDRWEIRQTATITCLKPGGLKPGTHEISAEQHIRASYIPIIAVSSAQKVLTMTS